MDEITDLIRKTIIQIVGMEKDSECIDIYTSDGAVYKMYHEQDCCENVYVEDVCGDVDDLIGVTLLVAEERTSKDNPQNITDEKLKEQETARVAWDDSFTWTFYHFATSKGYLDLRWYGESNGYYSESVDFAKILDKDDN